MLFAHTEVVAADSSIHCRTPIARGTFVFYVPFILSVCGCCFRQTISSVSTRSPQRRRRACKRGTCRLHVRVSIVGRGGERRRRNIDFRFPPPTPHHHTVTPPTMRVQYFHTYIHRFFPLFVRTVCVVVVLLLLLLLLYVETDFSIEFKGTGGGGGGGEGRTGPRGCRREGIKGTFGRKTVHFISRQ